MGDIPSELNEDNLEEFLQNDNAFVDYFNTFLSLPCFPERIFYNKVDDLLEQFTQKLVKDESDNVQLKYDSFSNKVQISYCVTVLDREKSLEWLKKYRLPEFIKSGLYAEFKLSKTLSSAQVTHFDTIKNDISRPAKLTEETSTSPNDGDSFSCSNSVFTGFDEGETGDGEITNDFIEETREKKSEMPNILLESFEGNFPSIYLNKTEENSLRTSQDEDECSELSVSVTSDSFETSSVSEINNNFDEKNNSVTRMDGSSGGIVKDDDVITDDVTGGDVTSDDVMSSDINDDVISDVKSSDAISNDVSNDDAKGDKNVANDVIDKDLIRSDVIGDDIIPINTGEYVNYVSKSIDNDSCVDPSDKLSESMESNEVRTKCGQLACDNTPLASAHVEITITEDNSTVQRDFIDISNLCDEKNVATSDEKHSDLSENIIAEAQDEQTFIKKGVEKKDGCCKCFHKTKDIASEEQDQSEYIEDKSVDFREQMNSSDVTRTTMDSKESYGISDRSNPSNTTQDSPEVRETSEDNPVEKLESSSFASKTPLLTTSSNTADNLFDSNEQRTEDDASEPKNHDTSQSPGNKSRNSEPFHGNPLQSNFKTLDRTENVSISINCTSNGNIDADEMSHRQNNSDSLENSSNVCLSKVEDRTSQNIGDAGIFDKNKIPQNAVEISSSDVKLSKIEEQTIFDVSKTSFSDDLKIDDETSYINDNIDDKNLPQAATVENTPTLHDIRILTVEDSDISESIKSERNFLPRSVRERASSANSFASSDFSVESGTKSSFADEQEPQMADDEMDLSSKAGMDKFKEFLMDTRGEALLLFWLEVETWKHIGDSGDKMRLLQEMKEQFLHNGSPLELPDDIKKQTRQCFTDDLSETQRILAEPLRSYWCPRFTLHQYRTQTQDRIRQGQKNCSPNVQPQCDILMYPSRSPHLVRPHSSAPRVTPHASTPREISNSSARHVTSTRELPHPQRESLVSRSSRETLHANSSREMSHASSPRETLHSEDPREKRAKPHPRSKSAQGRIVTTPYHTNAGKKQLEIYATPQTAEIGFQKRPISAFPPCDNQDYLSYSSVRLVINPRRKPLRRNAWQQRSEGNTNETQYKKPSDRGHESLVSSLTYENESGCFFRQFVTKQSNKLWLNCLSFWQAVNDYTAFFESDTLNPVTVWKKAQWIYTRYITSGSLCDIQLDLKTQQEICHKLDPPYEELFDCVDDHVLACLKEPWDSLCRNERRDYDLISKKETVRYLEVKLKRTRGKSRNSFLEELDSQDGRDHSERGKYSIEAANHPPPMPSDGVSFESVLKDRGELEGFQKFLEKKDPKGVMDLMAWTDMETFQRIPRTIEDKRNKKAKEVRQGYLNTRYFFGPDSPATKEAQNLILSMNGSPRIKERPSSSVITECQKYVRCRIEGKWLELYKASLEYKERQNPKQNVTEVVEDIMLRRRLQRSEAAWRILNSRWVSSSRDIVALRQTLNNPESCLAFRKFVALKGETYENDVLFWIEIQKYKDLCHRHASEQCIKKKIQAITECFITSSIPPELQVDVPIEMAEKLMERITSRNQNIGPYLFREVQMTVFRVLFNMWKDFCSFRSSINDENLLKVLDKKLTQHRADVKAKKDASERKKLAKQEAERKRKEKEDKEKKEMKSMEQLMSLMAENSSTWGQEENDVVCWKYSKHVTSSSSDTPSRQKKISTFDGNTSLIELTNQRSVATKSTNQITNSLRSEMHIGKVSKSKRVGSLMAESHSAYSKHSMKATSSTTSRIPKINQSGRDSKTRGMRRYDVIDKNSSEKMTSDDETKQQNVDKNKLLKNRERKKSKRIVDQELIESVSNIGKQQLITDAGSKHDRVKSPTVNDPKSKPRGKDSTPLEDDTTTERPGSLRTSVLRRQWNQSHSGSGSTVPLTSQLLKDFTNSPEGAPLDTPLSLARINMSDDVSVVQSSEFYRKTPPTSAKKNSKETNVISWRTKRAKLSQSREEFVPDVIVN